MFQYWYIGLILFALGALLLWALVPVLREGGAIPRKGPPSSHKIDGSKDPPSTSS